MITDDEFDNALAFLRDSAKALGEAKCRAVKAEHWVKHIEALHSKMSNASSADAREADARTSEAYLQAIHEDAVASGELAKMYALREAAAMKCESWRTQSATLRSLPRIHGAAA